MIAMAFSVSAVLANSFGARLLRPHQAPSSTERQSGQFATEDRLSSDGELIETVLSVPGIHCAACVNTIHAYLMTAPGVGSVSGDAGRREITVSFDPETITHKKIEMMINELGYQCPG